jgi:micrococcal nuclease
MLLHRLSLVLAALLVLTAAALAAERLPGPYVGAVERVVDGDTLAVRVTVWLEQDLRVLVRLRGIDAPELRGKCTGEIARAGDAKAALAGLVGSGTVVLSRIEGDKYFGRVLADVTTPEGADLAGSLIAGGFVRAYDGGTRGGWCKLAGAPSAEDRLAQAED